MFRNTVHAYQTCVTLVKSLEWHKISSQLAPKAELFFNVSIVNDNIPEDIEMFRVSLTLHPASQARLGNRVTVSPDVATFMIIDDNDSKQYTFIV